MKQYSTRVAELIFSAFIFLATPLAWAEPDFTFLGGDLTSGFTDRNAIQLTAPNVDDQELRLKQLSGFSVFHAIKKPSQGLGPFFNHNSCSSCHVNNGRGRTIIPRKGLGSSMVVKVSLKGLNTDGSPRNVPKVGEQLLDHTIKGESRYDIDLEWRSVEGSYPDGTKYVLRKPRLKFTVGSQKHRAFARSLRMTPPVIGPGLLEAISEETILSWSDPEDSDGDGISGRPQYVPNRRTGSLQLGRFGFRASHPTLEQQSAAAAFNDMGLINPIFQKGDKPMELTPDDLEKLAVYQKLAGVPAARSQGEPEVVTGRDLFLSIGCDSCHKSTVVTGSHQYEALSGQTIHPFTDLLLHDMGPELADNRAEYQASGAEWKTTPLWGLGFTQTLSNVEARYLHDGRARTIEEAILWHGGEAEGAKENFKNLTAEQRAALLKFLASL
jgi:CxxC motif-containing protein (DUF1111 family)